MAITHADIHKEKSSPILSDDEEKFLVKLEAYTDEVIRKEYGVNPDTLISLDGGKVDGALKGLANIRKAAVMDSWVELYKKAGWELKYSVTDESGKKALSAKKKAKKAGGTEAGTWVIAPIAKQ